MLSCFTTMQMCLILLKHCYWIYCEGEGNNFPSAIRRKGRRRILSIFLQPVPTISPGAFFPRHTCLLLPNTLQLKMVLSHSHSFLFQSWFLKSMFWSLTSIIDTVWFPRGSTDSQELLLVYCLGRNWNLYILILHLK